MIEFLSLAAGAIVLFLSYLWSFLMGLGILAAWILLALFVWDSLTGSF